MIQHNNALPFCWVSLSWVSLCWVHKTQIHPIQRWRHFGAQTFWSAFLLEKRLHPFLYWIRYSWSGLTHILYYINLSVSWNTLLRNQISSCQLVFYYTSHLTSFSSPANFRSTPKSTEPTGVNAIKLFSLSLMLRHYKLERCSLQLFSQLL